MRNIFKAGLAALLLSLPLSAHALNPSSSNIWSGPAQTFTPSLAGQTDQPGVTYTTDTGYFYSVGDFTYVNFIIVTSGTTTKTTTTDNFAVTLPIPSITQTGHNDTLTCDVENATPITFGSLGIIGSNTSQVVIQAATGTFPALNAVNMTWATTTPGIGVLSHVITAKCSGWYQTNAN